MERVRIVIADNHEIVRIGLRAALESRSGYEVCADAANGQELIGHVEKLCPDIVIMEVCMRGLEGWNAAQEILRRIPNQRILVVTRSNSEVLAREALQVGVRGLLLKSDALGEVLSAVSAIVNGRLYFTRRISEMLLQGYLRKEDKHGANVRCSGLLTPRENEIVKAIAYGTTNQDIAKELAISVKTIETHRSNIMRKLDLHSVAELVLYALRNNLLPFDDCVSDPLRDAGEVSPMVVDSLEDIPCPAHELTMATAVA
jgi:DNA-binding NarL/FixJ family response regulator